MAALRWIAAGCGYEITGLDVLSANSGTIEAAKNCSAVDEVEGRIRELLAALTSPAKDFVIRWWVEPHSHSIIDSSGNPLSYREHSSESRTFTVKLTVNREGIPESNFHGLSTSIKDDRRLGTGHLSRCIDIYRPQRRSRTTSPSPTAGHNLPGISRSQFVNFLRKLRALLSLDDFDVVLRLQIEPELRVDIKCQAQANRGLS